MYPRCVVFGNLVVAVLFLASPAVFAQSSSITAASDPQAIALASQALVALGGTAQIADITLTGTATRTAGSDIETGSVTLKALGNGESRLDLNLPSGVRSEVRNLSNGLPGGYWVGPSSSAQPIASHNCFTDAVWFFPLFSALSMTANSNSLLTYIGEETKNGIAVQHLQFVQTVFSSVDPTGLLQGLSTEDFYLNASLALPVAVTFTTHPDNNAAVNIPVEIDFSNYQTVNGTQTPFRIQKSFNGSLLLDITIQSAVLNSGLTDAVFATN